MTKSQIRHSQEWKELRQIIYDQQEGKDYFTGKPLRKGWVVHHVYFGKGTESEYGNLNPTRFIGLNKGTHELLHKIATFKDYSFVSEILEHLHYFH